MKQYNKNKYDDFISQNINEVNLDESILASTAPLAEIILTKKFYSGRNIELKDFTTNYLNENYRDYLFDGRPMLYARVVKDIFKDSKKDEEEFTKNKIKKLKNIQKFLKDKVNDNEINSEIYQNSLTKKSKDNSIDGWRNIINSRER